MNKIKEFRGEFFWLSNFAPCKIILNGIEYQSTENAYKSQQSDDIKWKEFCSNPYTKPRYAQQVSKNIKKVDNWNNLKLSVMENVLRQKFLQEPYRSLLIATSGFYLEEGNSWGDVFWGVDIKTDEGENNLGKILMKIRDEMIF